ncbi:MAG: DUF87 domain-containing protein [Anaerolineae bacterium]|nr:DUF87 domain-containing protein [Anaerolineae bacterium]
MKIEEDPATRYRYEIWFDYTRHAINTLSEGAMLAVPNFAGNDREVHYSILEVTSILPMHYALGTDTSGYPGFVVEAARNAGQDWMTQDTVSTEETTKIRCVAMPTNLEVVETPFASANSGPKVQEESNLPMVGHLVNLLDTAMTERIANLALDLERDNVIQIGTLVRDSNVHIYLRVEDLIKVHFGIFGFTGAGKSNLLSTLVSRLLTESDDPVKIVIFDLMGEYTVLLLDLLVTLDSARIINLGAETVPQSVLGHLGARENAALMEQAARDLLRSTILPKALKRTQDDLQPMFRELFARRKVWMLREATASAGDIIAAARREFRGNMGTCESNVFQLVKALVDKYAKGAVTQELVGMIESEVAGLEQELETQKITLTRTARANLEMMLARLIAEASKPRVEVPDTAAVSVSQIINKLNDASGHSLLVIQAHNPDELRAFASTLGNVAYESRRRTGRITPLVSFVFDEADEFIPGQAPSDSHKASKAVAMTLARRGRKFGLGIGIATQRIAHLDTNTLAQPHTYFVSKLPRVYDRQAYC